MKPKVKKVKAIKKPKQIDWNNYFDRLTSMVYALSNRIPNQPIRETVTNFKHIIGYIEAGREIASKKK